MSRVTTSRSVPPSPAEGRNVEGSHQKKLVGKSEDRTRLVRHDHNVTPSFS